MRLLWRALLILSPLLVLGYVVWLYLGDPEAGGYFPKCALYWLTGLKCPGCGGQRAVHCLLHGDIVGALRHNAYVLTFLPLFVAGLFTPLGEKRWYVTVGLVVTLGYFVFRNLPW